MMMRRLALGTACLIAVLGQNVLLSRSADARPSCYYMARDPLGNMMADGHAWALKKSWACNRAERRCKRELERKRRQGKAGRGSCVRITNY
jgi:hypothetical protein